ncbi:GNAT family N-acetyltransferase [Desulfoluna sp.]|uniref:GNAT family N-acetyltransferase n=1 Tax=Desulfoluna sp. TaxID=2045199 RepID=UPI00262BEDBA|nr:GNAT family N-acetyltransferase [Desulfoluna sp.]
MLTHRPITENDWPQILQIQKESYEENLQESLTALQSRWLMSPDFCFVAEADALVVGYALAHPWRNHHVPALGIPLEPPVNHTLLYMHDVAVSLASRGTGVAARLVNVLISRATACHVPHMALTSVQGSAPFWEKYGFQVVEYGGDLTGYGKGAVYMKKHLNPHGDA